MSGKKQNKWPEWFNGDVYTKGGVVANPFSGEEIMLTADELAMYDFIKGAELYLAVYQETQPNSNSDINKILGDFEKGLAWFMKQNAKAYMVLLD